MGEVAKKRALHPDSLVTSRSLPSFSYTPHTLVFCAVVKPTCLAQSLPEPSRAPGRDCDAQPQQREPGGSQLAGPPVPGTWRRNTPLQRAQRQGKSFLPAAVRLEGSRGSRYLRTPPAQQRSPRSGKADPGRGPSGLSGTAGHLLPGAGHCRPVPSAWEGPSGKQQRPDRRAPRVCACD